MYKALVFLCCVITLVLVSTTEAKGGRGGGGRSGGRGGGRSSRGGGGFFSSSSGGKSSSSFGSGKSGNSFSGGLFHGFFHSTPYRYTYRPTHIMHSSSSNTGSYHTSTRADEEAEQNKETDNYAVGYSISKGLSNDFFSIFNVVHDIAKYPDKIRNKELLTTTTPSPVSTYDLNYIVNPSYTITGTANFGNADSNPSSFDDFEETSTESTTTIADTNPYYADIGSIYGRPRKYNSIGESKKNLENNDDSIQSSFGNFENVFQVTTTERTATKFNTNPYYADVYSDYEAPHLRILKEIDEIVGRDWTAAATARPSMRTSLDSTNESIDEMMKKIEKSYSSLNLFK